LASKIKSDDTDALFKAILELKSIEECYAFFEDHCTVTEIKAMSQRLKVAGMLKDNNVYSDIVSATGASTATISRVNRCLTYGSDGYTLVLSRLDAEKNK
jgi:TrpR-related protein YerC/YecD